MKVFLLPTVIAGIALYALLFLPYDLKLAETNQPAVDEQKVINDYIELLEEQKRIIEELIRLEKLKQDLETGKAWSA